MEHPYAAPGTVANLMDRCWLINPSDRPRFHQISAELLQSAPLMVRCRDDDRQPTKWEEPAGTKKLEMNSGDLIAVLDGRYSKVERANLVS